VKGPGRQTQASEVASGGFVGGFEHLAVAQ
jgi:hypothetical protein